MEASLNGSDIAVETTTNQNSFPQIDARMSTSAVVNPFALQKPQSSTRPNIVDDMKVGLIVFLFASNL